jgi:acetate kinase
MAGKEEAHMKVTVINCGSSSIKYEVFEAEGGLLLATGLIERIGGAQAHLRQRTRKDDGDFEEIRMTEPVGDHRAGFDLLMRVNAEDRLVQDESDLLGIGHRVVHGGERFREPTLIDEEVVEAIRALVPLAPLHNPANLLGIEVARERFPRVPQVAVFDTAFHQTLPPEAYHYAVPYDWYAQHGVRKYGFHGSSHLYVSREAARHLGKAPEDVNLITLHLGNGASAAAIQGGRSVDTTMGLTPLEGLVMGTRSGDIDPALHFYLMRQTGISAQDLEAALNSRSGLKGICGLNDMREIQERAGQGNERARLALGMFCRRIKKVVGAYWAVLGQVCSGLESLGICVDAGKNAGASGEIWEIQEDRSPVTLLVIRTDEEREIARQTIGVIARGRSHAPA